MALLKKYTDIEKLRFSDKIDFNVEVNTELLDQKIPPLILQPIIENSIKHGFSLSHDKLRVTIVITETQESLYFKITNNGQPLKSSKISFGTGLENVLSRLTTIYGSKFTFKISNKTDDTGVQADIVIPKENFMSYS